MAKPENKTELTARQQASVEDNNTQLATATRPKRGPGFPTKYRDTMGAAVELAVETHSPMTDEQVAEVCGVSERAVKNWYHKYPEFLASVKKTKAVADEKVVRSLYERATGYSVPDIHISNFQGKITRTPIIKHYPPDPVSCIFWLKNRAGWRDKKDLTITAEVPLPRTVEDADKQIEVLRRHKAELTSLEASIQAVEAEFE